MNRSIIAIGKTDPGTALAARAGLIKDAGGRGRDAAPIEGVGLLPAAMVANELKEGSLIQLLDARYIEAFAYILSIRKTGKANRKSLRSGNGYSAIEKRCGKAMSSRNDDRGDVLASPRWTAQKEKALESRAFL